MAKKPKTDSATVARNRKAWHDYFIEEEFEAGIALQGWEVKCLREGRAQLKESYVVVRTGELFLTGAHFSPLNNAASVNPDPVRDRKLLLHRDEIDRLASTAAEKGYTIVALRLYIKNHVAKAELALARGKRQYDKRQTIINRELDMEARRAVGTVRG